MTHFRGHGEGEPKQRAGVWQHAGSHLVGIAAAMPAHCGGGAGAGVVGGEIVEVERAQLLELHVVADGNARYPHLTSAALLRVSSEAGRRVDTARQEQPEVGVVCVVLVLLYGVVVAVYTHTSATRQRCLYICTQRLSTLLWGGYDE